MAMRWLHWKRRCPIVIRERSPRSHITGRPDVLAVTKDRHLVEVEIKRSVSDLRANLKKRHMQTRFACIEKFPRVFYFLVHHTILQRAEELIPSWAGLAVGPTENQVQEILVVRRAPINKASKRVSLKECVKMVFLMTNQIMALEEGAFRRRIELKFNWNYGIRSDYEI